MERPSFLDTSDPDVDSIISPVRNIPKDDPDFKWIIFWYFVALLNVVRVLVSDKVHLIMEYNPYNYVKSMEDHNRSDECHQSFYEILAFIEAICDSVKWMKKTIESGGKLESFKPCLLKNKHQGRIWTSYNHAAHLVAIMVEKSGTDPDFARKLHADLSKRMEELRNP